MLEVTEVASVCSLGVFGHIFVEVLGHLDRSARLTGQRLSALGTLLEIAN
jgi:hypothetical protein